MKLIMVTWKFQIMNIRSLDLNHLRVFLRVLDAMGARTRAPRATRLRCIQNLFARAAAYKVRAGNQVRTVKALGRTRDLLLFKQSKSGRKILISKDISVSTMRASSLPPCSWDRPGAGFRRGSPRFRTQPNTQGDVMTKHSEVHWCRVRPRDRLLGVPEVPSEQIGRAHV